LPTTVYCRCPILTQHCCISELSTSGSGYGNERENARAEKEYETATAKGWRPCPSCKKMVDVTQEKVFNSSAFEPSEEELAAAIRASKNKNKKPKPESRRSSSPVEVEYPIQKKTLDDIGDITDSSDEDLPDVKSLLLRADKGKNKPVKPTKNIIDIDVCLFSLVEVESR
jgi:hypothetical protein